MKKNAGIYLKEKDKKRDENEKKININKKMKRLKGKIKFSSFKNYRQ